MKLLDRLSNFIDAKIFWVRLAIIAASIGGAFYGGLEVQYLVERDRENVALKAANAAKDAAEAALATEAAAHQKAVADLEAKKRDLEERIKADAAANPHYRTCRLSPGTIKLLNE